MYIFKTSFSIIIVLLISNKTRAYHNSDNNYRGREIKVRHDTHDNTASSARESQPPCNLEQLEYRIRALETQIIDRTENLRSEVRQNHYRLRVIERQSANLQTILENFRQNGSSQTSKELKLEIDNLSKGMQIMIAALKNVNTNIGNIKSSMTNYNTVPVTHHSQTLPENCHDLLQKGTNNSGIYLIQPHHSPRAFMVLCDLETKGGGWTYVLNRYTGTQNFYLDWQTYKVGFGNLGAELWLGLDNLHQVTGFEVNELLIDLVDLNGNKVYAYYDAFSVGSEEEGYPLKVLGSYSGTAGDSLSYHAGCKFSTKDKDQDEWAEGSCAQAHNGAWWYKSCDKTNLNGKYLNGQVPDDHIYRGMYWNDFHGPQYSLLRVRMMVRPKMITNVENDILPN